MAIWNGHFTNALIHNSDMKHFGGMDIQNIVRIDLFRHILLLEEFFFCFSAVKTNKIFMDTIRFLLKFNVIKSR